MSFFQKLCPAPFPPGSSSSPGPSIGPQFFYNLLEEQPENSWHLGGKWCIISNPSRYSGLHLPCFLQHVQQQLLSVNPLGQMRHTMLARSLSVGGIPSRAIGLPGIMFATLGVSSTGLLGPNSYDPSPKVTNLPLCQISTPLLWNIQSVASYQFVLKPLTNSYNQDPAPLVRNIPPPCLSLKYSNVPNRTR